MLIFETERLDVRQYTIDDSACFFRLNGDNEVMRYIRPVKTKAEADIFLEEVINYAYNQKIYGRWAVEIKQTKQYIGTFALIPVENSDKMQLGYALLKEYWGFGYATELTLAGLKYCFSNTPLQTIYAYTEKHNLPSQKVLEKTGFIKTGELLEKEKQILEYLKKR